MYSYTKEKCLPCQRYSFQAKNASDNFQFDLFYILFPQIFKRFLHEKMPKKVGDISPPPILKKKSNGAEGNLVDVFLFFTCVAQ